MDLNQYIVPTSVFEWLRNVVANRLASNGQNWTEIFSQYNSGTYNNGFMVRSHPSRTDGLISH